MIKIHAEKPIALRRGLLNVSMELTPGQGHALIGPNGIGKTSFFQFLKTNAKNIFPGKACAFLDQHPLFPLGHINTHDLLRTLKDFSKRPIRPKEEADALINALGMTSKLDRPIRLLSGGENQASKILATFLFDADVFILDEPTNHLDAKKMTILIACLKSILAANKYLLLVEHKKMFLEEICDRFWSMEERNGFIEIHSLNKKDMNTLLTSYAEASNDY